MTRRSALALAAGAAMAAMVTSPPHPAAAARSVPTGFGVDIRPRATWAGDDLPFVGSPEPEDVRFLLVHHTAGPATGDPVQIIRGIHSFHTSAQKGWPDVAYNFFIEPGGTVYEGRANSLAEAVEASATGGNQGFAQLVCLLGDFTARNPTPAALTSLNATLAWLADRYGLDTSSGATASIVSRGSNRWPEGTQVTTPTVSGHRDMSRTACPGDTFYPYLMAEVQGQVDALRANPASTPSPVESTPDLFTTPPAASSNSGESGAPSTTVAPPAPAPSATVADTSVPPTTVAATIATGPVGQAPEPLPDERAIEAPTEGASPANDGGSASGTAISLGVAGVALVGGAAIYAGVRSAGPTEDASEGEL